MTVLASSIVDWKTLGKVVLYSFVSGLGRRSEHAITVRHDHL